MKGEREDRGGRDKVYDLLTYLLQTAANWKFEILEQILEHRGISINVPNGQLSAMYLHLSLGLTSVAEGHRDDSDTANFSCVKHVRRSQRKTNRVVREAV